MVQSVFIAISIFLLSFQPLRVSSADSSECNDHLDELSTILAGDCEGFLTFSSAIASPEWNQTDIDSALTELCSSICFTQLPEVTMKIEESCSAETFGPYKSYKTVNSSCIQDSKGKYCLTEMLGFVDDISGISSLTTIGEKVAMKALRVMKPIPSSPEPFDLFSSIDLASRLEALNDTHSGNNPMGYMPSTQQFCTECFVLMAKDEIEQLKNSTDEKDINSVASSQQLVEMCSNPSNSTGLPFDECAAKFSEVVSISMNCTELFFLSSIMENTTATTQQMTDAIDPFCQSECYTKLKNLGEETDPGCKGEKNDPVSSLASFELICLKRDGVYCYPEFTKFAATLTNGTLTDEVKEAVCTPCNLAFLLASIDMAERSGVDSSDDQVKYTQEMIDSCTSDEVSTALKARESDMASAAPIVDLIPIMTLIVSSFILVFVN